MIIVLGILATLAAWTGQALIGGANDSAAQKNVATAALAAETWYTNWGSWPTVTQMASAESAYTYVDGSTPTGLSTSPSVISVATTNSGSTYSLAVLSASGSCFVDTVAPAASSTPDVHVTTTPANCYATTSASGASW